MMEDKKIERLFQEKLKDFEVQPSPLVWDNIESNLTKKKKRRIFPIWWFSSGVASLLIIGLFLYPYINDFEKNIPIEEKILNEKEVKIEETNNTNKENVSTPIFQEGKIKKEPLKFDSGKSVTSAYEKRMISRKIKKEKKPSISSVSLKGLQANSKIAMKSIFVEPLIFEKDEKVEEKMDFIAEINKKKNNKKEKIEDSKWSISPVIGILSSQSLSQSSSIDASLNENEISNPGTFSYGVSFTFDINEKLSIKSGVQFQNMSYHTENIGIVSNTTITNNLENISFNGSDNFLYVSNSEQSFLEDIGITSFGTISEGTIEQDINYMEFPVELKYRLFMLGKFQTSLVSGFSTLFLTDNLITTRTANFSREIGKANNLNKFNFSANLGLDVEFNINKKARFNINPMFKSQLNTFSDNPTNFRPFIIGVYSGLRYSF
ncbi:hypothetical protein BTO06_16590 [Tenacibaculum sp. SZ-18]|uniref:outer membrane beta-barrel protein n=1 Tax=Tenacibaculum sp. SZ-18 TaxID=754423 RepID=UPI000C2D1E1F|nr:outer membrane beta-barrel protein [Tenacibaculum sp. SZ-18]AUC16664.1 hypothetical protein BTO06_16590 [Tenacibaculum sp. SZ-18]